MGATQIWNVLQTVEPAMGWEQFKQQMIQDVLDDADEFLEENPTLVVTEDETIAWLGICRGIVLGIEFGFKKAGIELPSTDELRKMRKGEMNEDADTQGD